MDNQLDPPLPKPNLFATLVGNTLVPFGVFLVVGPLVGAALIVGTASLFMLALSLPVAYTVGAIAACSTGLVYAVLRFARVSSGMRYFITAPFGGLMGAVLAQGNGITGTGMDSNSRLALGVVGFFAALVCTAAADRVMRGH